MIGSLRLNSLERKEPLSMGGPSPAAVIPEATMAQTPHPRATRGRLFRKYLVLLLSLVSVALLLSAAIDLYFLYLEDVAQLAKLQLEKAETTTERIGRFFAETESQIGWTTHVQWAAGSLEQRRFDYYRLLRQVPAITEVSELDSNGKEQLKVSRLAIDVVASELDFSHDPSFTEALKHQVWFSPVYLREDSEPYLTMAVARAGKAAGVTVAEVNLKLIWGVISSIKIGATGYAYVVDRSGRLVAHTNIDLVLHNTNFGRLPYVAKSIRSIAEDATNPAEATVETSFEGRPVMSAHTALPALGWLVFVELPLTEALAPVYSSALRSVFILLAGLMLATLAALFMVRRMVGPIRLLQNGAARIGAGDLESRITVRTGDELEALADQFNTMTAQLREYNSGLERTVAERTQDLARSVRELQALSDVVRAVNSTLDLRILLAKIVTHAIELSNADAGAIFRLNPDLRSFELAESAQMAASLVTEIRSLNVSDDEATMAEAVRTRTPIQFSDITNGPESQLRDAHMTAGFRGVLVVPLIVSDTVLGTLFLVRRRTGDFAPSVVELMSTFASQSALAMQNAALFQQIEEKSRQLEQASEHKSQFLANMSHELRTPLNAILGYTELLVDGIYGELPEKPRGVLDRVQENGRNLLALINDVLDLAKIEAGQLTLTLEPYQIASIARNVVDAMHPLARAKGLLLGVEAAADLPLGYGDARRLQQALINLVGNAIKFTESGSVDILVAARGDRFKIAVRDTGPGIALEDQDKIFAEFQQVDNSSTRRKGGTGLGLAISRQIVMMHSGSLTVVSAPGAGSTFEIDIPVRVNPDNQGGS